LVRDLKVQKRVAENTMESCLSKNRTVRFLPAWRRQNYRSPSMPGSLNSRGCGSFHCFEERCLKERDFRRKACSSHSEPKIGKVQLCFDPGL
jgi:hypothetical protein